MSTLDRYQHALAHLAASLAGALDQYGSRFDDPTLAQDVEDALDRGHTLELRFPDGQYTDANGYTRIDGFRVGRGDAPLFRAMVAACLNDDRDLLWTNEDVYRAGLAAGKAGQP